MNTPQFKIHGKPSRNQKKALADLKSFVKNFWRCHQMDKDMGGEYVMSDEKAQKIYDKENIVIVVFCCFNFRVFDKQI